MALQNTLNQMGQGQQPNLPGFGSSWWHYLFPQFAVLGRYGGQGQQGSSYGQNIWESLFGSPAGIGEIGGLDDLLKMAMQQYQNPYEGFDPIRQSIGNQFKQDILPSINNQFNAQTGGHFSSGILGSNIARGTASLADRLAAAQAQYGQNQRNTALSAINAAKPQYFQQPSTQGLVGSVANTASQFAPYLL